MLYRLLLDPKGAEGNGNPTATETPATPPDLGRAAEGLVAKHGDPTAALRVLLGENYSYRDQLREVKGKLPPEGSVVLTGDKAKDWEHYQGLGKPSDLRSSLAERDTFRAENEGFRKAEVVRSVAEVSRFKPSVLGTLVERDKLTLEVVDDTDKYGKPVKDKDGAPVRVAVVKGEGDEVTRLHDYAAAKWGDFLPALKGAAEAGRPGGTPTVVRSGPLPRAVITRPEARTPGTKKINF